MSKTILISRDSEQAAWQEITRDVAGEYPVDYSVTLLEGANRMTLNIVVEPGGGFEGDYEFTTLSCLLSDADDFLFAIHSEDFVDEIFKFFGMQDLVIGFPDFDERVVVKANDEARVKGLFADDSVRRFFCTLDSDFTLGIVNHDEQRQFVLTLKSAVTDAAMMGAMYDCFCTVLARLGNGRRA